MYIQSVLSCFYEWLYVVAKLYGVPPVTWGGGHRSNKHTQEAVKTSAKRRMTK